ncbi:unnamed protein product [Lactuca saligna]|uniref:Uncharacterized protein n=1 Tax=Lactuca saligna TaxID=75948 RepID=A0AA35Y3B6_LACSI|nr:unnamed protein product [Lactuca saligna]
MNSPPRMKKHFHFSTTSSSSSSTDDVAQHGLTPLIMVTAKPMIQDNSMPLSPQFETVPFTLNPMMNVAFHQVVVPNVPLNVVYPRSYFKGEVSQEVPQGTDSYFDSDNYQLSPRKRKASISGGTHEIEVGSSTTFDPSTSPPKMKSKLIFDLNELSESWRLPIEEVREIMFEYNVAS